MVVHGQNILAAKIDITNHSVFEEENNETFVGNKEVISTNY